MAYNGLKPIISRLDNRIAYILNPEKTMDGLLTGGVNTTPPSALVDMQSTQERFGKCGGRLAYHLVESFAPGEITVRKAMRMGRELIHRYLGDRYEAVYAVHNDHEHIHVHVIWNATSFIDGIKFHAPPGMYLDQIRRDSDELCRESGYSVIERGEKNNGKNYGEWQAEKNGQVTLRDTIRKDVNDAIRGSVTWQGFLHELKLMGYEIKITPKNVSLLAPNAERFIRLKSLGAHYSAEVIKERIIRLGIGKERVHPPTYKEPQRRKAQFKGSFTLYKPTWKGLRALYFHYLYLLRKARNSVTFIPNRETAYLLRQESRRLDAHTRQVTLLNRHKLDTTKDVQRFIDSTEAEIADFVKRRNALPKEERADLNAILKEKRRDLRTANAILQEQDIIRERLRQAYRPREQEQSRQRTRLHSRDDRDSMR